MMILALATLLLSLGWLTEGIRYHRSASEIERRLAEVLSSHPTLQSRLTRENIYKKYATIDREQRRFRQTVRAIGTLVSKDSKLDLLALDDKGYRATISVAAQKRKTLESLAKENGLQVARSSGNKLQLQGTWQ
jgi:hypothetical protein